jgi:HEAT repeat protein
VVTVIIQGLALAGLVLRLLFIRSIDALRERRYGPLQAGLASAIRLWSLGEGDAGDVVRALRRLGAARAIKAVVWASSRVSGQAWEDLVRALAREPWVAQARRKSRARHWPARRDCARLLSVTAKPEDTAEVIRLLRDPHPAVSIAIVPALERLESDALDTAILDRLPGLGPVLLAYFAWTIRRYSTRIAGPLAERLRAADGPTAVRLAEFGVHLQDPALRPVFLALAAHADPEMRVRSARALGRDPGDEVSPVLERLARDEVWQVRLHAVRALGRIAAPESLAVAREALGDPVHWVRLRAGAALLRLGEPGRQALAEAASGEDAGARDVARLLLPLPAWTLEDVAA